MLRDVAVLRGLADRTVNELSSEISVSGVAEGFCDDENEHVVQSDRLIATPRPRTRSVELQCLDRCI